MTADRHRVALAALVLAVAAWLFSLLSIFTIGVFVAPAAIPLFALGAVLWPSRTHIAIGIAGSVWGISAIVVLAVVLL